MITEIRGVLQIGLDCFLLNLLPFIKRMLPHRQPSATPMKLSNTPTQPWLPRFLRRTKYLGYRDSAIVVVSKHASRCLRRCPDPCSLLCWIHLWRVSYMSPAKEMKPRDEIVIRDIVLIVIPKGLQISTRFLFERTESKMTKNVSSFMPVTTVKDVFWRLSSSIVKRNLSLSRPLRGP